jgi:hypothetical protein
MISQSYQILVYNKNKKKGSTMSKLDEFLALPDVSEVRKEITVEVNGKPMGFVIRPLTQAEHGDFQNRSYKMVGNKAMFNVPKYSKLVLANCLIEPNFNNAEFLKKAKCLNVDEFLDKKFPAGVLSEISSQIQKISGFDSLEAEIDDAKN